MSKILAAFISENLGYHLSGDFFSGIELQNFFISHDKLDFHYLMHSFASTPSRYLEEVVLRLKDTDYQSLLVFNPLYIASESSLIAVLHITKQNRQPEIVVFADRKGIPVAYLFPKTSLEALLRSDLSFLRLVSCVNSKLDRELIELIVNYPVAIQTSNFAFQTDCASLFFKGKYLEIFECMCERAINCLKPLPRSSTDAFRNERDKVSNVAIVPYHAGDVLFWALAARATKHPFSSILTCSAYQDIAKEVYGDLELQALPISPAFREDQSKTDRSNRDDHFFFEKLLPNLSESSLFYFFRSFRPYSICSFHLIDQLRFALGESFLDSAAPSEIASGAPLSIQSNVQKSVLLHFDGGWPLKIYPKKMQDELIELLKSNGFSVTVLTDKQGVYSCPSIRFSSLKQFETLLSQHSILVGMDSFPAHYSIHVKGHPTICLFSSTRSENSNATTNKVYDALSNQLDCCPCSGWNECPRLMQEECANFVSPIEVLNRVRRMFSECYQASIGEAPYQVSSKEPKDFKFEAFFRMISVSNGQFQVDGQPIQQPGLAKSISKLIRRMNSALYNSLVTWLIRLFPHRPKWLRRLNRKIQSFLSKMT